MILENKNSILLHACCAPCSIYVVKSLSAEFNVCVYFYNPNIYPEAEYIKRLDMMKYLSSRDEFPLYTGEYDYDEWLKSIKGREDDPECGERCSLCYRIRLEKTAQKALDLNISTIGTTLTVSPHKKASIINEIGNEIAALYGVKFHNADFKKKDGYKKSIELSRIYELYRQNYCGCSFSIRNDKV